MNRSLKKPRGKPVGERFTGTARDLNSRGQGVVAHPSGRIFFVPGIWPGEEGDFEVVQVRGGTGSARLLELTLTSPERLHPPCPHHGLSEKSCGGCPWMFISYGAQLAAKQERVDTAIHRLAADVSVQPIWGAPESLGYRNRAQLKTDGRQLGFVASGARTIAPVSDCLVLNEHNRRTLQGLAEMLPNNQWRPARRKTWNTLDFDDDIDASQVTVNQRRPFRQGNSAQNRRMQAWVREQVGVLPQGTHALELFAGSGNFTEVLSESVCDSVIAVDSFEPAVRQLASRGLPGVTTLCRDLDRRESAVALEEELCAARLLLLDPPRDGCRLLGDYLDFAKALKSLLYISCDLASFTRDAELAQARGFTLRSVQPVDVFPQTPHIELLTYWSR